MVPRQDNEEGSPTEEEDVMKKIGEYTTRGKLTGDGDPIFHRIQLFDGRFDTGYRVTRFVIWPAQWATDSADAFAILFTEDAVSANAFNGDAGDNTQIAWAAQATQVSEEPMANFSVIDRDNMVIEDLFITVRGDVGVNYLIELEKYDISDWQGALTMVRNKSQG